MRFFLPSLVLASLTVASTASAASTECSMTRDEILATASADRRQAVERGFAWLDDDVAYSQSASHEGYRTDCSGFVSMCWDLGRSSNTASLYSGDANTRLDSYDDLVVADALVKQGHIVLFLGWNDDAHSGACVLEQASTASDMQFRVRTTASLKSAGYKAIRSDNLTDTAPAGDDATTTETSGTVSSKSPVTPKADTTAGDPGDPDEEPSTASDDDSASNRNRRAMDLDTGGCSTIPGHSSSPTWTLPLLVVLGAMLRRRRQ